MSTSARLVSSFAVIVLVFMMIQCKKSRPEDLKANEAPNVQESGANQSQNGSENEKTQISKSEAHALRIQAEVFQKSGKKLNIKQYYFLLPEEAMFGALKTKERRESVLSSNPGGSPETTGAKMGLVTDSPENGYLAVGYGGNQHQEYHQFAIWRRNNDSDVIGINDLVLIPANETGVPRFFTLKDGKWHNITQQVFSAFNESAFQPTGKKGLTCGGGPLPKFPDSFYCELPHKGLSITCHYSDACGNKEDYYRKPEVQFVWANNKFSAQ